MNKLLEEQPHVIYLSLNRIAVIAFGGEGYK